MAYEEKEFIKEMNGKKAPAGFHYMPNGRLMSDADHIAVSGYIEKTISNINIDTKDINYLGESRSFRIIGEQGSFFSLEIYDDSNNYYDFVSNTWSSSKKRLSRIKLDSGGYSGVIVFPILGFIDATCDYNNDPTITHDDDDGAIEAGMLVTGAGIPDSATVSSVTSDTEFELSASTTGGSTTNAQLRFSKLKTYTINLIAETVLNVKTKHSKRNEIRYIDGSININSSTGSNSNILKRVIYQDVEKKLYLSCIAPSRYSAFANVTNAVISSAQKISFVPTLSGATSKLKYDIGIGDLLTHGSAAGFSTADWLLTTAINPDGDNVGEITVNKAISIGNSVSIAITPPWNGVTPHSDDSTSGRFGVSVSSGKKISIPFSITVTAPSGRVISIVNTPTISNLCAFKEITFGSAASAISGEDTSSDSYFYRWPITNVAGLSEGMMLDPDQAGGGVHTTTPASISPYITTATTKQVSRDKYNSWINSSEYADLVVPGIDTGVNEVTAIDRNGNITAQAGTITFDTQQEDALKSDSGVKIFGYGADQISSLTGGMKVSLSNVKLELAQVSETTAAASSASTTIALDEVGNVGVGSEVSGVNINSTVVNPTVTYKSTNTGAGNITVSSAQTLEDGQKVFFDGVGTSLTITGNINASNLPISDTTLYFDLESFLDIA